MDAFWFHYSSPCVCFSVHFFARCSCDLQHLSEHSQNKSPFSHQAMDHPRVKIGALSWCHPEFMPHSACTIESFSFAGHNFAATPGIRPSEPLASTCRPARCASASRDRVTGSAPVHPGPCSPRPSLALAKILDVVLTPAILSFYRLLGCHCFS